MKVLVLSIGFALLSAVTAKTANAQTAQTASTAPPGPGAQTGTHVTEDIEKRRHRAAIAFAPFDAGNKRNVVRQGNKGRARAAHPNVGDAAKVPGEGPPPPPLRLDPDIPESAIDKPNVVTGLSANPLYLASLVYSNLLTKLDGPRCGHLPTCSRFASQAVGKHGAIGILMGLDRLQQPNESSAIRKLPEIEGFGGARGFDPVDNYEFWKSERFTGFPPATKEEPLDLKADPKAQPTTTTHSKKKTAKR